jgi:cupin 2 domain-containing protein
MNFFAGLPNQLANELFTTLLDVSGVRIERIVSQGQASPDGFWYDQDQHEWVMVLRGAAQLRFEKGTLDLKAGDFINIPLQREIDLKED